MQAKSNLGFTLVELITVIIILGVLAATALPKYMDLGKDTRIAALDSLKGAITTAAKMGYSKCVLSPNTCSPSLANQARPPNPSVSLNGVAMQINYGYPSIGYGALGLDGWITFSGFTRAPYVNGSGIGEYTKDGAPDPTKCKVTYDNSRMPTIPAPVITVTVTGC